MTWGADILPREEIEFRRGDPTFNRLFRDLRGVLGVYSFEANGHVLRVGASPRGKDGLEAASIII